MKWREVLAGDVIMTPEDGLEWFVLDRQGGQIALIRVGVEAPPVGTPDPDGEVELRYRGMLGGVVDAFGAEVIE